MKRVLYFTKYQRKGASSRLRSYQYFPLLEQHGFQITVKPFFDDSYLDKLYNNKRLGLFFVLFFYIRRFFQLFTVFRYQKIVIEKELFPFFFPWFEKLLFYLKINYITDYDDAIYHNYDLHTNKWIRNLFGKKIDVVMKYSQVVIAGNDYLAERAKQAGAKNIIKIPTVIDISRYKVKETFKKDNLTIGWIGSPSTLWHLKPLTQVFNNIIEKYNVSLTIIGATEKFGVIKNIHYIEWKEETEIEEILKFDIGIMPLTDTPFVKGKCAYKLVQYMGCGLPVVASPVSANNDVVTHGENGFLANSQQDWFEALEKLILDENLRIKMGAIGRKKAELSYSHTKTVLKLIELINLK